MAGGAFRVETKQIGSLDIDASVREVSDKAARLSVNTVARWSRTQAIREINALKHYPGRYVRERMRITQFASDDNLVAILTGRYRATQLVRFGAKQLTRKGKTVPRRNAGISFKVNRDSARQKMRGAFFVNLRAGKEEGMNRGVAIQQPGKNSKGNRNFKVLYSSSVHNSFRDVRENISEQAMDRLQVEYRRQLGRLRG